MAERSKTNAETTAKTSDPTGQASTKIPDLLLERYALDELPAGARADLERRLAEDPDAQARLSEIRRTNQEILTAYPPETVVPDIERRVRRAAVEQLEKKERARRGFPLLVPVVGVMAAAAVLVIALRPPQSVPDGDSVGPIESTRLKGQKPALLVYPKPAPGEAPRSLKDGAAVRAHALLQIAYVAAGRPHGVVLSIDGRGAATLHHPSAESGSSRLESGQVLLPSAYELDDAPLFERFFFITSAAPIDVAQVMAAARKLGADKTQARSARLPLPAGLDQTSLLLIKEGAGP
jgi:hypothetical protein